MIDEFKNFGKTLAESNSKALMDALTDAIKDFNQKMAEQFGENFKQFNVAVGVFWCGRKITKQRLKRLRITFK